MKSIYVRYSSTSAKYGYEIESTPMYKEYSEYGICIVKNKYSGMYTIIDTQTGLYCGRRFSKLKDAKSFIENGKNDYMFLNWYDAVEHARTTERYKKLIIKVR